jgi:muconate/chloromuconate cycloisomerase
MGTRRLSMKGKQGKEIKIKSIEKYPIYVPFKRVHKISLGGSEGRQILLIRVHTDQGITGIGEALGHPAFSGEVLESLLAAIRYLEVPLIGRNALNINENLVLMDKILYGNYGAKAAIEMALFDIMGKYFQTPLYTILGGKLQDRFAVSRSISQSNLEEDLKDVSHYLAEGYNILKIKVGILSVEEDIERVKAIRAIGGSGLSLRTDANQSWDIPSALKFIKAVEDCNLTFIEQPIARGDVNGLAYLKSKSATPILADEAVSTEHDLLNVIEKKAADFISLKVLKSGGIMKSRRIAALAECAGIKCYLGSQVETSVGTSASLHFVITANDFRYGGEIYGPAFFVEDVVKNPLKFDQGYIYPSDKPGLGVDLDMGQIEKFSCRVS